MKAVSCRSPSVALASNTLLQHTAERRFGALDAKKAQKNPRVTIQATRKQLLADHGWLGDPELEVCIVGSRALAEACDRAGLPGPPAPADLDLAWRPDAESGVARLGALGIEASQTSGALGRGTLGIRLGRMRVEITSFRGGGESPDERIALDAASRDMTFAALYHRLHDDAILDPCAGLDDWQAGVVRACGNANDRIREHPIRALRYLRRAAQLGFRLETKTRKAIRQQSAFVAREALPEAIAGELRRVLAEAQSPGVFFELCAEERLLPELLPEVAPLFDGRPAGRLEWHPELSQSLHMILAMAAAARRADELDLADDRRLALQAAVLCHDLGKGLTSVEDMPSHPGHEAAGVALIDELFARLPALGNKSIRRLCKAVARAHVMMLDLRRLKSGTLVELWERDIVPLRDDIDLVAIAVRADQEGRLSTEQLGLPRSPRPSSDPAELEARLVAELRQLDEILSRVSGAESARLHQGDPEALRADLHQRRCVALKQAGFHA